MEVIFSRTDYKRSSNSKLLWWEHVVQSWIHYQFLEYFNFRYLFRSSNDFSIFQFQFEFSPSFLNVVSRLNKDRKFSLLGLSTSWSVWRKGYLKGLQCGHLKNYNQVRWHKYKTFSILIVFIHKNSNLKNI